LEKVQYFILQSTCATGLKESSIDNFDIFHRMQLSIQVRNHSFCELYELTRMLRVHWKCRTEYLEP